MTVATIWGRQAWFTTILALGGFVASDGTPARADKEKAKPTTFEVETIEDIAYYQGKDADQIKHKLDLYIPKGGKDFPVLFFVHGGAWRLGDKAHLGVYRRFGNRIARHGIGVVVTNYRLSPKVKHPAHIQDVAKAFAWTCKHIKKYGGRTDEIFVSGHSAGGHLAALLATDDSYLKAEGLTLKAIRGVIPISGVYRLPETPLLEPVFGEDKVVRSQASPISHARADAPPFLLLCAETDWPSCGKRCALAFCKALQKKKCLAEFHEIKDRSHVSILLYAYSDHDPTGLAILQFIHKLCTATKR
jgi:acetyl esterase/lipase